jgi:peptide/nickel transport system ATP-binding protein
MADQELLRMDDVSKHFKVRGQKLRAVQGVSLRLRAGETVGLVGESGSGKSTLGRLALRLLEADGGHVFFKGEDLAKLSPKQLRSRRRQMQIIFQDPLASLSPRMTVGGAIEDAMVIQKIGTRQVRQLKVDELLARVGLSPAAGDAYPFELSGGQQQRVGIARALAVNPDLIVCDEPVSALDVSIQVQVIQLLKEIQREMNIGYLFISHNLGVVQYLSDYVVVLYLGEVVEQGRSSEIFTSPGHPYTRVLIDSILKVPHSAEDRRALTALPGEMPSPFSPPPGCPFHPRCPMAFDRCRVEKPELRLLTDEHLSACHLAAPLS